MTRGVGGQSPSNVAQHLKGIDFPCRKKDLIQHARKNQAGESILKALDAFPEQEYSSMAEVMEGFGESRSGAEGERKKSTGQMGH
jgi:hypothetical protein